MNVSKEFESKGFTIIKNLTNTKSLAKHFLSIEDKGKSDEQAPHGKSFYRNKQVDSLQKLLLPKLEKLLNLKLFKTYNYSRIYRKNSILRMHRDRPACEISLTINIANDKKQWPIYITDYDEYPHKAILNPGDALIYHGCDLWHWRSKFKGNYCIQTFLHYVDQEGPHSAHKDDQLNTNPKS